MPGTARKVTIVLLIILTLALAGVAAIIAMRLQQQGTVAPPSADAAGFGSNATKDLYDEFGDFFASLECEEFLAPTAIQNIQFYEQFDIHPAVADILAEGEVEVFTQAASGDVAINCTYQLDSDHSVDVTLYAYNLDSVIDANPSALYTRVNTSNISSVIDSGSTTTAAVFFGSGLEAGTCVSNIYHAQNDFERVTVSYDGFANCDDIEGFNQALSKVISDYLVAFVSEINGEKVYDNLCDGWAREQTSWCDPEACVSYTCGSGEWVEDEEVDACAGTLLCNGNPDFGEDREI